MTAAQATQQQNRHTDGTYAEKVHAEDPAFAPPLDAAAVAAETARRLDAAGRLRVAEDVAAEHPVLRSHIRTRRPQQEGRVTAAQEAAGVDASIDNLRTVATWRLDEATSQIASYQVTLTRRQGWVEKLLWGRGVTQLAQERLTHSQGVADAASRILDALNTGTGTGS